MLRMPAAGPGKHSFKQNHPQTRIIKILSVQSRQLKRDCAIRRSLRASSALSNHVVAPVALPTWHGRPWWTCGIHFGGHAEKTGGTPATKQQITVYPTVGENPLNFTRGAC